MILGMPRRYIKFNAGYKYSKNIVQNVHGVTKACGSYISETAGWLTSYDYSTKLYQVKDK